MSEGNDQIETILRVRAYIPGKTLWRSRVQMAQPMNRLNPKRWLWPRAFSWWAWPIVALGTSFIVVGTLMLAMRAIVWVVLNNWDAW